MVMCDQYRNIECDSNLFYSRKILHKNFTVNTIFIPSTYRRALLGLITV